MAERALDALERQDFDSTFEDWRDQFTAMNGEPPDPRQAARAVWDQKQALIERLREAEAEPSDFEAWWQSEYRGNWHKDVCRVAFSAGAKTNRDRIAQLERVREAGVCPNCHQRTDHAALAAVEEKSEGRVRLPHAYMDSNLGGSPVADLEEK